jgi:hypothetical protein
VARAVRKDSAGGSLIMSDVVFVTLALSFFLFAALYARACTHL